MTTSDAIRVVLIALRAHIEQHQVMPTAEVLAQATNFSPKRVTDLLGCAVVEGFIRNNPGAVGNIAIELPEVSS